MCPVSSQARPEQLRQLRRTIEDYRATCAQEAADRIRMLQFLDAHPDCLLRENQTAHFTASAWIVDPDRTEVLLIYHNLYDSWAWTGGHADGDADLLRVALREAAEESGADTLRVLRDTPISLEVLTVDGHQKHGAYVPSHLHMNLTYLLELDPDCATPGNAAENQGARWIPADALDQFVTEPWMLRWIYPKLLVWNRTASADAVPVPGEGDKGGDHEEK